MKKLSKISFAAICALGLAAAPLQAQDAEEMPATVADVAMSNDDFSTLVAAVKAAGLAETLMGEGPFTVFAPTNEAFAKLPEGTVEELLKPENKEKLTAILMYHVVPAKVMAADVKTMKAETAGGAEIQVTAEDGNVMYGEATVTATDIEAKNGVVHVIDTVVMPPKG